MALTLMYITNNPVVAQIAQNAGVERIWIDMEYIGKSERQKGMNTVQNHHSIEDIKKIRPFLDKSELMVRVNPIHEKSTSYVDSRQEINDVIDAGADIIMLPMFRTEDEVNKFIDYVGGRAKVLLLLETSQAVDNLDSILNISGIDEIHIGLNDLSLAYGKKFMFELLCDGTVEQLCHKIAQKGITYGFGGIARIGFGLLPAEYIIAEHYRLKSSLAILSRSFCDANIVDDPMKIADAFTEGIINIRKREEEALSFSADEYEKNYNELKRIVSKIISRI